MRLGVVWTGVGVDDPADPDFRRDHSESDRYHLLASTDGLHRAYDTRVNYIVVSVCAVG